VIQYVAEMHGGQISGSEKASFVFSENPYEEDTERSFDFVYHSKTRRTFFFLHICLVC